MQYHACHVLRVDDHYLISLNVRSDTMSVQNGFCSDKCKKWSENVRCPTVISSSARIFVKHFAAFCFDHSYRQWCIQGGGGLGAPAPPLRTEKSFFGAASFSNHETCNVLAINSMQHSYSKQAFIPKLLLYFCRFGVSCLHCED